MFGQQSDSSQPVNDSTDVVLPTDNLVSSQDWQHPGAPLDNSQIITTDDLVKDPIDPLDSPLSSITNDLIDIKQKALSQLSPLISHLDQSPEEKFRTTMMMIQASDNQNLINTAYEAALQIADEKSKAQALLDIINEINYFTQQDKN